MCGKGTGVSNPNSIFKTDIRAAGGKCTMFKNATRYVHDEAKRGFKSKKSR